MTPLEPLNFSLWGVKIILPPLFIHLFDPLNKLLTGSTTPVSWLLLLPYNNRCVMGNLVWCLCVVTLLIFYVGVGAFVIGLSQISSFCNKIPGIQSIFRPEVPYLMS